MKNDALPVNPEDYQALYPFKSNCLSLEGLRYHYVDEGSGDPVVMVHGNPTWSFYFRSLIRALSPDYRTIAPDHIGCGLSDKPGDKQYPFTLERRVADFGALMDHLELGNITLVVHDWGGMIAMAWAVANPNRIARIVVTNTATFFPPGKKGIPKRLWIVRNLSGFSTPAVLHGNLFARAAIHMAPHQRLSKAVARGLLAPYNCPANRLATLRFVQDIPLLPGDASHEVVSRTEKALDRLAHLPVLILWGRHDFVFDVDYFHEWRRRFPKAEHHLWDDAGHYLFEDVPDRIIDRIKGFLSINTFK